MSFFELLENTPKIFGFLGIFLFLGTLVAYIFNLAFKFRITGAAIFSLLLSLSSWAFIQSYTDNIKVDGAKYIPTVYDNGFDLIVKKAEDEFPEEAIEPTLKELSENLKKGSRSGSKVKIKIRKLEKISKDISRPVIIGETEKTFTMN